MTDIPFLSDRETYNRMKLIHTSDWHLGQQFYGYDRTEEHLHMLRRIREIVEEEKPDLFLLCGDVFHTSQPSAAAQKLLTDGILSIREACPDMPVVMIAGNHDSASRHDIFRNAWRKFGVYTVGSASREESGYEEMILNFPDIAQVVAVPYFAERFMPEDYFTRLLSVASEALPAPELPVILLAHTTVEGCDTKGHDDAEERYVGGINAIPLSRLGDGFDYCALGHIHRPQFIHGSRHKVRYSGTPIAVSFDEDYPHSVSVVEIDKGKEPVCREIDIDNPRPLVTLPATGFAPFDGCLDLLKDFDSEIPAYIRLNVEIDDSLPVFAMQKARDAAEGKNCTVCVMNTRRRNESDGRESKGMTVSEFRASNPLDIARRFAEDTGFDFSEELEDLFKEALDSLSAQ